MALTKDEKKAIETWFIKDFWTTYPADLCGSTRNKGSRGESLKIMVDRIKPDQVERERILGNLKAQIKYDRDAKNQGADPYRWPYCETYLRKRKYDDEIEAHSEISNRLSVKKCKSKDCKNEVHGPRFDLCTDCLPFQDNVITRMMRDRYKKITKENLASKRKEPDNE